MKHFYIISALAFSLLLAACTAEQDENTHNTEKVSPSTPEETTSLSTSTVDNRAEIMQMTREQAADLCQKDGRGQLPREEMLDNTLMVDVAEETESGWRIEGEFYIERTGDFVPMMCDAYNGMNGKLPHATAVVFDLRDINPEDF